MKNWRERNFSFGVQVITGARFIKRNHSVAQTLQLIRKLRRSGFKLIKPRHCKILQMCRTSILVVVFVLKIPKKEENNGKSTSPTDIGSLLGTPAGQNKIQFHSDHWKLLSDHPESPHSWKGSQSKGKSAYQRIPQQRSTGRQRVLRRKECSPTKW